MFCWGSCRRRRGILSWVCGGVLMKMLDYFLCVLLCNQLWSLFYSRAWVSHLIACNLNLQLLQLIMRIVPAGVRAHPDILYID